MAVIDRADTADRRVDVTDEDAVRAALDDIARTHGGLDVLVCCAGISGPVGTLAPDVTAADRDDVMTVNVKGAFLTVKHAVPHLTNAPRPAIVLLASDSSLYASEGMAPYCA